MKKIRIFSSNSQDEIIEKVNEFIEDIHFFSGIENHELYKTPNGYAVVVPHRFDTRELMEKWKDYDITLHKDRLIFLGMITKE